MTSFLRKDEPVVHAAHGLGRVTAFSTRKRDGGEVSYVAIDVDGMVVKVPTEDAEKLGVRRPMDAQEVEAVLTVLGESPAKDPGHLARRRRNAKRLMSGAPDALAKVVRSLRTVRRRRAEKNKPLSYTDKKHLDDARDRLREEMALVLGITAEQADQRIDDALAR